MSTSKILRGATAIVLAAALALPVSALGVPGNGGANTFAANPSRSTTAAAKMAAKQAALRTRIARVLASRTRAFDAAATAISTRIGRVRSLEAALAAKLPAGTVVSFDGVDAELANAGSALESAKTTESAAVAAFRAVPDATTTAARHSAFRVAMAKAKSARLALTDARAHLRNAVLQLESLVNSLAASE